MSATDFTAESVFASEEAEIHDVPMRVIQRPVIPVLDACKVEEFKKNIEVMNTKHILTTCTPSCSFNVSLTYQVTVH